MGCTSTREKLESKMLVLKLERESSNQARKKKNQLKKVLY